MELGNPELKILLLVIAFVIGGGFLIRINWDDPRYGYHPNAYFGGMVMAILGFAKDLFLILITFGRYKPSTKPDKEHPWAPYFIIAAIIISLIYAKRFF